MTLKDLLDRVSARGRGPLFAALLTLLAALPGVFALPATDRDEARFAEASAQMLETGDFTTIMFQDEPRFKKPVGIYWLQALSVKLVSAVEKRDIWAYRLPSVLGAMLAAGACAWGAAAFLRPGTAVMAGVLMASTFVLSTEAILATTDAALCGCITLAMAALGRLYFASQGGPAAGRWVKAFFWVGLAGSVLLKGPIGPMVVGLTVLALCLWDRKAGWLRSLGWSWGPIIFFGMTLPWALAITVATDGGFWGTAVGGDLAPKLVGGQEGHGAPPGFYTLLSPLLTFPACLLLPAALVGAWRGRAEPGLRFAICWLAPAWLVFELVPTKLPHYTLPTYGALAWMMAAVLEQPLGVMVRWTGAAFATLAASALIGFGVYAAGVYGDTASWIWAAIAGALFAASAIAGVAYLFRRRSGLAAVAGCGLGLLAHAALAGGLAPSLRPLWVSERVSETLARAKISPSQGLAQGPVTVAGYAEPSIVFALGAHTELGSGADAADAIDEGRPAVVEARQEQTFQKALADQESAARLVGTVAGLDYSTGHPQLLRIYQPVPDQPMP
ncbi:MAG: ArnT family glycosyltransferase [Caulobacterales bacterium]